MVVVSTNSKRMTRFLRLWSRSYHAVRQNAAEDVMRFEQSITSKVSNARVGEIRSQQRLIGTPAFVVTHPGELYGRATDSADSPWRKLPILCDADVLADYVPTESEHRAISEFLDWQGPIFATGAAIKASKSAFKKTRPGKRGDASDEGGTEPQAFGPTSPEEATAQQKKLGVDIIGTMEYTNLMPMSDSSFRRWALEAAMAWQERSLKAHRSAGVPKESMYANLLIDSTVVAKREQTMQHARRLGETDFDGYFLTLQQGSDVAFLSDVVKHLPAHKPLHLRRASSLNEIRRAIEAGVDTFDSPFPLDLANEHHILTSNGLLDLSNPSLELQFRPPDPEWGEQSFTLAYLHHLVKAFEPLAVNLCALHNQLFLLQFADKVKKEIADGAI